MDSFRFKCLIAAMLLWLLLPVTAVIAAESVDNSSGTGLGNVSTVEDSSEVSDDQEAVGEIAEFKPVETLTTYGGFAGYRFLHSEGNVNRAEQYSYLHSGIAAGGYWGTLGQNLKFAIEGTYLNNNDYHGDLLFDENGEYRIHMKSEALYHNLQRETLFSPESLTLGSAVYQADDVSAATHGIKTDQSLVDFRYKPHDFPLHINLGYWRLARDGNKQLRFADSAFEGTANRVLAVTHPVDQQTQEGSLGLDTHLGPLDFIYAFQIRQFANNATIPVYSFDGRPPTAGITFLGGDQQHNEDPESRYFAHTVKLHSSLTGGVVGAASYTYGKRENRSSLTDIIGARQVSTTLQNVAGDFFYTPAKEISLALKFRRQQVENTSPATIYSRLTLPSTIAVRPSFDSRKESIIATLLVRPSNLATIKGEYTGEFLHRDLPSNGDERLTWLYLNENQEIHRGTVALLSRPLKGLKISANYRYQVTANPTYGTGFATKHEGNLLAAYTIASKWGVTAAYRSSRENNDEIARKLIELPLEPLTYQALPNLLWRDKSATHLSTGVWFAPIEKLTVSANYSFLRNSIDQAVMFSVVGVPSEAVADYTARANLYSLSAAYHYTDNLDVSLAFQQIYSFSEFQPESIVFSSSADTNGIKEITQAKTVESSISVRGDYHLSKFLTCSLDYTLRDYRDKHASQYNGSIHSVMAQLSTSW